MAEAAELPTAVAEAGEAELPPSSEDVAAVGDVTAGAAAGERTGEGEIVGREAEEFHELLVPDVETLPAVPPSAVEVNFTRFFAPDFLKPGHDQYVYRHPNGLCIIGIAPTHIALQDKDGITAVDFNVGKSDRSELKVTGKRKRNAQHFESNTALCKMSTNNNVYIVRCCVKGMLLEVNDRLIKHPDLLNTSANREGYIAIIMPKPADWNKVKDSLLCEEDYMKLKGLC